MAGNKYDSYVYLFPFAQFSKLLDYTFQSGS
jgi:hypothetical protein